MIKYTYAGFSVREETMGFLDNLLRRAVSGAVDTVADGVINAVLGKDGQNGGDTTSAAASANNGGKEKGTGSAASKDDVIRENEAATGQGNCSGERLLRQRIEEIAAREKPEYELRQKVSGSLVDAPIGAEPCFDYGFFRDGRLVAVIRILCNKNAYCRKSVWLAEGACKKQQVAYMNFMSYMTNRPEYISRRLEENLQ